MKVRCGARKERVRLKRKGKRKLTRREGDVVWRNEGLRQAGVLGKREPIMAWGKVTKSIANIGTITIESLIHTAPYKLPPKVGLFSPCQQHQSAIVARCAWITADDHIIGTGQATLGWRLVKHLRIKWKGDDKGAEQGFSLRPRL